MYFMCTSVAPLYSINEIELLIFFKKGGLNLHLVDIELDIQI
jgi:hypothetical protein